MTKLFRMDNTEGYSQDELAVLNTAFDIICEDEDIPTDAADEYVSADTRQFIGECVEAVYHSGMTPAEIVAAYYDAEQRRIAYAKERWS